MSRCHGCSLPDDPPNGRWDCDLLKNGDTVCMLQCEVFNVNEEYSCRFCFETQINVLSTWTHICLQIGFTIKGKHIIQCQRGENEFSHRSSASSCQTISKPFVKYLSDENFENTKISMNMTIEKPSSTEIN